MNSGVCDVELLDSDSQNCDITNTGSDGGGYCTYNSDNVCYIHCYSGGGVGIGNRYRCYHSLIGGGFKGAILFLPVEVSRGLK